MVFFDPKNIVISEEEWLHLYENIYFYMNRGEIDEKEIDKIYKTDAQNITADQIKTILKWKLGSRSKIYLDDRIVNQILPVYKQELTDWTDLYDRLYCLDINGLGSTTMICLISFRTNGAMPIYDRFAAAAVAALKNSKTPYQKLGNFELPFKVEKDKVKSIYVQYASDIESLSIPEYRTLDRALWAYGHLFTGNKIPEGN